MDQASEDRLCLGELARALQELGESERRVASHLTGRPDLGERRERFRIRGVARQGYPQLLIEGTCGDRLGERLDRRIRRERSSLGRREMSLGSG